MKKTRIPIFIITFLCIFFFWNKVITIDRSLSTEISEDSSVDYVLLGSSHIYHGVNPLEIWNETGYIGYNLGTDLQMPETSYFCLKEYIDNGQIPEVVFFDFFGFTLVDGDSAYNLETSSRYPMSIDKINYIKSIKADERLTMIFPFLQFHSRWEDLNKNDYSLEKNNGIYNFMGYLPFFDIYKENATNFYPEGEMSEDYIPSDSLMDDFEKIYNLCKENGIELVVIKTPSPDWSETIHSQVQKNFADRYGVEFIDFNDFYKEIGFDVENDFADIYHLNNNGAKKITEYLAEYMQENYTFEDKRDSEEAVMWDEKYQEYLHYIDINKSLTKQAMEEYLEAFTSEEYLILITNKDKDGVKISAKVNDEIVIQESGEVEVSKNFKYDNKNFYIESTKVKDKIESKIQVDFQNYSKNEKDINIVVYDLIFDLVISTRSY